MQGAIQDVRVWADDPETTEEYAMTASVLPENKLAREYQQAASGRQSIARVADSRPYDPNNYKSDYGSKLHPNRTMVVLQTLASDGAATEYRVGTVSRHYMQAGMRCKDGTSLNRHVAERCFKGQVYLKETEAVEVAKRQADLDDDIDGGIKIIRCHEQFPGAQSSLDLCR